MLRPYFLIACALLSIDFLLGSELRAEDFFPKYELLGGTSGIASFELSDSYQRYNISGGFLNFIGRSRFEVGVEPSLNVFTIEGETDGSVSGFAPIRYNFGSEDLSKAFYATIAPGGIYSSNLVLYEFRFAFGKRIPISSQICWAPYIAFTITQGDLGVSNYKQLDVYLFSISILI